MHRVAGSPSGSWHRAQSKDSSSNKHEGIDVSHYQKKTVRTQGLAGHLEGKPKERQGSQITPK